MKTNERAKVILRFISRPEFLTIGSRLIFREGSTKGMGEVIKVNLEHNETPSHLNGSSAAKKFKANNCSPESRAKKASLNENNAHSQKAAETTQTTVKTLEKV